MESEIKIIKVVPLGKNIFKEELTYFTEESFVPGEVIEIPVRGRPIKALVVQTKKAREEKQTLKGASFVLQKIRSTKKMALFSSAFIEAASITADYFGGSIGQVLNEVTPNAILENLENFRVSQLSDQNRNTGSFIIQGSDNDREGFEKRLIRESFAKNESVFIASPTVAFTEFVAKKLSRGIEDYVFFFHSELPKKEILKRWKAALGINHPILIIATKSFFSLPRSDVRTLIIEKEGSSYRQFSRPFIDLRYFAEIYAKKAGIRFVLADSILRVETFASLEKKGYEELLPARHRIPREIASELVDMRQFDALHDRSGSIEVLSPKIRALIYERSVARKDRILVIASRRGVAPETICGDCREVVMCENCTSPLVLHGSGQNSLFLCHKCGKEYPSLRQCVRCGSWKLFPFGIGVEKVADELKRAFPTIPLYRFDSDTVKTPAKIRKIISDFTQRGGVLVATEMILPYLNFQVTHAIIAAIDNLFTLPDFRINEKIVRLLFAIKETAEKSFTIQTRKPNEKLFEYVLRGSLLPFYREELSEREKLGYPPFTTILRISRSGKEESVRKDIHELEKILTPWDPIVTPAFISIQKNEYRMHLFIKLPRKDWPEERLRAILKSLPPSFVLQVDPEGML